MDVQENISSIYNNLNYDLSYSQHWPYCDFSRRSLLLFLYAICFFLFVDCYLILYKIPSSNKIDLSSQTKMVRGPDKPVAHPCYIHSLYGPICNYVRPYGLSITETFNKSRLNRRFYFFFLTPGNFFNFILV